MKITAIDTIENKQLQDGLGHVKIEGIHSSVVLVVGKNGSGKSRLLNRIMHNGNNRIKRSDYISTINEIERITRKTTADRKTTTDRKSNGHLKHLERLHKKLAYENALQVSDPTADIRIVKFSIENLTLTDPETLPRKDLINKSEQFKILGLNNISMAVLARLQHLQDIYWNVTHQESSIPVEATLEIKSSFNSLKALIRSLLNTDITRSKDGSVELFGKKVTEQTLSNGQKALLQFCLGLHAQGADLKNLILVIDEPENHLHPAVLIDVLNKIVECLGDGQIWIATHSLSLLAHFNKATIIYVEDGKFSKAGKTPSTVLKGLLGNETEITKLAQFLTMPAIFSSNQFAHECLFSPGVASASITDPQTHLIKDAICNSKEGSQVSILDYGAGKGRLLTSIYENAENKAEVKSWLNYVAFDSYPTEKDACKGTLEEVYGSSNDRYFTREHEALGKLGTEVFDIIILCNVLHEIDPIEWIELFNPENLLSKSLKKNGGLLLVEDTLLSTGELAYRNGFLVLSTSQIRELFNIPTNTSGFKVTEALGGRLQAHFIPKSHVQSVSRDSRNRALKSARKQAKNEIKSLRESLKINSLDKSFENGRKLSFWVQQFANSQFICDELGIE